MTALTNDWIKAGLSGNATQFCSLLANSPYATNPGQAPNQPYSAQNLQKCEQNGITVTATSSSTLRVGRTILQGNQALVSVIGQACNSQGCQGTDDANLGMPGPGTGSFAEVFEDQAENGAGTASGTGEVLACEQIAGRWYVLDDASDE